MALALGLALAPASGSASSGAAPSVPGCSPYAAADYAALREHMMHRDKPSGTRYYDFFGLGWHATVWPHSQAAAAALDMALACGEWPSARRSLAGLERFASGRVYTPLMKPSDQGRFYDDNAWIGLDFIQALSVSGRAAYLERARRVFSWLDGGFSPQGGIYWNENSPYRNAATNGPVLQLALHLYEETGKTRYLEVAKRLDQFLTTQLRDSRGVILDGILDEGELDRRVFSYNQGTYIGASVQLYELTGDPSYLSRATETASAALDYFAEGDRLWTEAPPFNAIFFRNLLDLDVVAPDPRYRAALEEYLARARDTARLEIGIYQGGGLGHSESDDPASLIDQAALVQMHALLGMSPAQLAQVT